MVDQRTPAPVVLRLEQVQRQAVEPGVTLARLLDDSHGCHGLHQRRLTIAAGSTLTGTADGLGESWYVLSGSASLAPATALSQDMALWMRRGVSYQVRAREPLEVLATTIRAEPVADGAAATQVVALADCEPERAGGDREFRVLLSSGLTFTQFVGEIPPGRAAVHHHTYDEVVHVLSGRGVVHLADGDSPIAPGTSIYLAPYTEHCLENTGSGMLRVLGVFHPAGSPAAAYES